MLIEISSLFTSVYNIYNFILDRFWICGSVVFMIVKNTIYEQYEERKSKLKEDEYLWTIWQKNGENWELAFFKDEITVKLFWEMILKNNWSGTWKMCDTQGIQIERKRA